MQKKESSEEFKKIKTQMEKSLKPEHILNSRYDNQNYHKQVQEIKLGKLKKEEEEGNK